MPAREENGKPAENFGNLESYSSEAKYQGDM